MNGDAIGAVQAVSASGGRLSGLLPGMHAESFGSRANRIDLSSIQDLPAPSSATGGAYLRAPLSPAQNPAIAPLHLGALDNAVRDGFEHGFIMPQSEKLVAKLAEMNKPGSNIEAGDLVTDMMVFSARTSLAGMFAQASTKLADSLNSIVTKTG